MRITVSRCRYVLAALWFTSAGALAGLLFLQQVVGYYGPDAEHVWRWFSQFIVPTLSLMVGVLVATQRGERAQSETVDRAFFWLTLGASVFYLLLVLGTILVQPFSTREPLEIIAGSTLYLTPLQAVATGLLAAIFVKRGEPEAQGARQPAPAGPAE